MSYAQDFAILLPAAGEARRFGGDKLALPIADCSVLEHSVRAFIERRDVSLILVIRDTAAPLPLAPELLAHPKLRRCDGGATRTDSVRRGLAMLLEEAKIPPYLAVHDAARPAVSQGLIDRVFTAARQHGAAVPGLAVIDTIKRINPDGTVAETLPRCELVAVQTPQAMRLEWLTDAIARSRVPMDQVTDDVQLLEFAGFPVQVVEGDPANLKLTRPADLAALEQALAGAAR